MIYKNVTVDITPTFELEQIFCNCSTNINEHYPSCGNFGKDMTPKIPKMKLTFEDGHTMVITGYKYVKE